MAVDAAYEFGWRPGIGDPTIVGWFTVGCYLLAAFSAFVVAQSVSYGGPSSDARQEVRVWRTLAVLFLLLGINKQLDLQSAFTEVGRYIAHHQGWYESRQAVQFLFVCGIVILGALAAAVTVFLVRGVAAPTWVALLGTAFVLTFVVIRAASFHHVDVFISTRLAGVRWNWILEIGGLTIVLIGAWLRVLGARWAVTDPAAAPAIKR